MTKTKKSQKGKTNVKTKSTEKTKKKTNINFKKLIGSRSQVFNGTAFRTSGGLKQKDLLKNATGNIVSKNKSLSARDCSKNPLCKDGHLQKKGSGKFGSATSDKKSKLSNSKVSHKKSTKKNKKSNSFLNLFGL